LKSGTGLTLKRNIAIKSIVTEDFKKYLVYELQEQIKMLSNQVDDIDKAIQNYLKDNAGRPTEMLEQAQEDANQEKYKRIQDIRILEKRIDDAKNLSLNTLFQQGMLEGLATIKEGDNLYNKLGQAEIILKDGIVQEIKTT
jgi:gas vesicle protein